jgi:putative membrane protein
MHGFLGTRASLMLDVVFLALFAVVPALAWSIWQVRYGRRYLLHKRVQLTLATVLLLAVLAFEIDMRFFTDWHELASPSPYFASPVNWVKLALAVHLCFAVPTTFLWLYVVWHALAKIPDPPRPSEHSAHHKRYGWLAAWGMAGTGVTGWIFYYLAFIAERT